MNSIYSFTKIDSGEIIFNEKPIERSSIAYLESAHYFYPHLIGMDYLELFKSNNKNFNIELWNNLMKLPLEDLISSYSSGMKKKLALMGIIALNRPVLLLDEPFNTLDLESVELLKKIIPSLKEEGKIIIVTSHILETLTEICNEIHYLIDGKIISSYTPTNFEKLTHQLRDLTDSVFNEWAKSGITITE